MEAEIWPLLVKKTLNVVSVRNVFTHTIYKYGWKQCYGHSFEDSF